MLFFVTITEFDEYRINPKNYELELLASWKNFNKPRAVLKLDSIDFIQFFNISGLKTDKEKEDFVNKQKAEMLK